MQSFLLWSLLISVGVSTHVVTSYVPLLGFTRNNHRHLVVAQPLLLNGFARRTTRGFWDSRLCLSSSAAGNVVVEMELADNFARWRFMQQLLDEEMPPERVNQVLYAVLESFVRRRDVIEDQDPSLMVTPQLESTVHELLSIGSSTSSIEVLSVLEEDEEDDDDDDLEDDLQLMADPELLAKIELLLPDPEENKDAHTGAWDTLQSLHGIESVKINERNQRPSWISVCTIARVLIYFSFLGDDWL